MPARKTKERMKKQMQKMREKLNANAVGATSSRPLFGGMTLKNQKGITLIALIVTIIVMLILVGVTINVALNGGLFSKAEEATTKTKIAQIQEALTIKKAEVLAEYYGVVEEYTLTLADLDLPTELENEFSGKLIIGTDGKLYYDGSVVTNKEEQDTFKSMGIQEYVENPIPNEKTYPSSYANTDKSIIVIETSSEEAIIDIYGYPIKCDVVPCTDIFSLKTQGNTNTIINNSEVKNLQYTKALVDKNGDFKNAIYMEELGRWTTLTYFSSGGEEYYLLEDVNILEQTTLTEQEIDSIIQSANNDN